MRKRPELFIDITGPDGNIYFILAKASQILRKHQRINDYNNLRDDVCKSKSYDEALYKVNQVIELIDISEDSVLEEYLRKGKLAYQQNN